MGLTDAMTRLSEEIGALRQGRETFRKDLAEETRGMKTAVSEMRAGFANAHAQRAMRTKRNLTAFVSRLKRGMAKFRQEFRADLAGASRGFFGPARGFAERSDGETAFQPDRKRGRQRNAS